ncbi:hypothetical protein AYO38_00895 [bacterium SCGC AG-212-C10]|nr:hypothetical protein AYO38_00895 [bacterium SCGC AG-212-C10]
MLSLQHSVTSKERNIELLLLSGGVAFLLLAWRALEAAEFTMPDGSARIVTQFMVIALSGHIGLRIVAPGSAAQPFAIALLLTAIGLAFATRLVPELAQDQANWATLGIVAMVGTAAASRQYPRLRAYKYTAAAMAILLLVVTGLIGTTINGARLWITVGGREIQTTEIIKVFIVIFLAGYLADSANVLASSRLRFGGRSYSGLPYILPLVLTLLIAIMALALLKDLGSVALLILLSVAMLAMATGRLRFLAGGIVLLALTAAGGYVAFDHAQVRIDTWRDPYADAGGAGYQTVQSIYALEAGGVTGEGLGLGRPDVIPAVATDYVFAAIGEELGFAGAFGVVLLYTLLVAAGLKVAIGVRDDYGRLLACCVALLIGIQAAVIIAGNLRLIPTTGITLPFVSYGGSSLVVNFALLGLLLGVSHQSRANQR